MSNTIKPIISYKMYFENLEDVKQYSDEIICLYSDNDPYVKYEAEKENIYFI